MIEVAKEKKIPKNTRRYTLEEYFQLEEKVSFKSEFANGKITPMVGDTINHSNISGTIYFLLMTLFFNSDEEIDVYSNDQRVYISDFNKVTYTDTFVVKGAAKIYENNNLAILNPTLIVEVTSKSAERYDRTTKFRMYQSLPSFKEYVIIKQDMPIIEVFYKIEENKWQMTSYIGLDKVVKFETINQELKMTDIYKKAKELQDPQLDIEFTNEKKG